MYYLGIDGGGTKTTFNLCDENGNIITSIKEPTCHYLQVGIDGMCSILSDGLEKICKNANITEKEIAHCYAGIPGYGDTSKDVDKLKEGVTKSLKGIEYSIGNDGVNALAGALNAEDGINIVAGTGSIGFGYNSKNNMNLSCGGWLYQFGSDEGSGYWMSHRLLLEFSRQADGRDEKTNLYYKVMERLNLERDTDIISIASSEWKFSRTKVAALAPIVEELYNENDEYAIKIVNDAAKELADIIIALYKRLSFDGIAKVSYTGGIFKMGKKILEPLESYLPKDKYELVEPSLGPSQGSLLLALKNGGVKINETIINNLKK